MCSEFDPHINKSLVSIIKGEFEHWLGSIVVEYFIVLTKASFTISGTQSRSESSILSLPTLSFRINQLLTIL